MRVRKASSTTSAVMLDFANNIRAKCNVQLLSIQAISGILYQKKSGRGEEKRGKVKSGGEERGTLKGRRGEDEKHGI